MLREIEARLHCNRCDDTPYTIYRVAANNAGVFVNKVEPLPPGGVEIRCPMCAGPLARIYV